MDQQQNKAQEAEAFARVWKRVSPDPDSSPIQCGEVPLAPAADPPPALGAASLKGGDFLRAQILWELTRWRTYQALARAPGSGGGSRLAALALGRAKRMAAVLFLLTGVWYLPRSRATPRSWKTSREGYRLLFQGAQRAELRYRAAAQNNPDPVLGDLFRALAAESAREAITGSMRKDSAPSDSAKKDMWILNFPTRQKADIPAVRARILRRP